MLGPWAILSPWTIAPAMKSPGILAGVNEAAMWNHYVIGIAMALLAAVALIAFKPRADWVNVAIRT